MRLLLTAVATTCLLLTSCQSVKDALPGILAAAAQPELTPETIASGLREALDIGTTRAVTEAAKSGAYTGDTAIHIPLPERLQEVANTLRKVGLAGQVDTFERKMNEAAEQAALQAAPVFGNAIRQITFADAKAILQGGPTAATDYFREKTGPQLAALYEPIVKTKLSEVGAMQVYDQMMARYNRVPLAPKIDFTPTGYATEQAIDGLFTLLADQERQIRENPAARTTALLKRVFGQAAGR